MKDKIVEIGVNENNQLVVTESFKGKLFSSRKKDKQALDSLSFDGEIETKNEERELKRIVLDGVWSLTDENELKLKVIGNNSKIFGKYIILRGNIEKVDGSKIGFRIRECDTLSNLRTRNIQLSGRWAADSYNRLNFKVSKLEGRHDILCFQGAWDINKHNELIYKYTEVVLKTKRKILRELVLKGHWSLARNKITYVIENEEEDITFKAQILRKTIHSSATSIKYSTQVTYIYKGKIKKVKKMLEISGKLVFRKDFNVEFKIKYSGVKKRSVHFIVEKVIYEKSKLSLSLVSSLDKKPCFEVLLKKPFKDDVEFFLALSRYAHGGKVLVGARVRF